MGAGRELDELVAEKVMHWQRRTIHWLRPQPADGPVVESVPLRREDELPAYSTDIAAAWEVVEHMSALGWSVDLGGFGGWSCVFWRTGPEGTAAKAIEPTVMRAICLAALAAVGAPAMAAT